MKFDDVERVANAILYEGYALYPYRSTSLKNHVRFTFGGLYPRAYTRAQTGADNYELRGECLVLAERNATLFLRLRFLQLTNRELGRVQRDSDSDAGSFEPIDVLKVDDREIRPWQEAVERDVAVTLPVACNSEEHAFRYPFAFSAERSVELVRDAAGRTHGVMVRTREAVSGELCVSMQRLEAGVLRLRVFVENQSDCPLLDRSAVLPQTLAAAHLLLGLERGTFVSLLEPEQKYRHLVSACTNLGVFPVLLGPKPRCDRMLLSPIILYDYPEVAAQSPGDAFDATEIDEILSLRILTLSEEEKREMRGMDPQVRGLLDRTEALAPDDFANLHGVLRSHDNQAPKESSTQRGGRIRPGDRVRLWPRRRADIFDIALAGRVATVRSVEQDYEDRVYLGVTIEGDPGEDLGISGHPGHRFFFGPDEVEPINERGSA